jgi:hypothetical protein
MIDVCYRTFVSPEPILFLQLSNSYRPRVLRIGRTRRSAQRAPRDGGKSSHSACFSEPITHFAFCTPPSADPLAGAIGLYVPTHAYWYPAFLNELLNFPAGKDDDQVDAVGLIGQLLDRMGRGAASPTSDQKIRFMNEMTMDEVWSLDMPKRQDWDRRI